VDIPDFIVCKTVFDLLAQILFTGKTLAFV